MRELHKEDPEIQEVISGLEKEIDRAIYSEEEKIKIVYKSEKLYSIYYTEKLPVRYYCLISRIQVYAPGFKIILPYTTQPEKYVSFVMEIN